MTSMDERSQIDNIKRRIAQIPELHFNPCLTEAETEAFEREHNIRLPEGYRLFLKEVGNGGDGPSRCEGLAPLPFGLIAEGVDLGLLDQPFPLTGRWIWEGDDEPGEALAEDQKSIYKGDSDALIDVCLTNGQLDLGTNGCNTTWYLIVTGTERGQIWQIAEIGAYPCAPKRSFLEWYELWLDWRQAGQKGYWEQVVFADLS
jgi:hypothetical protein